MLERLCYDTSMKTKRPRDISQLAKLIVDQATDEEKPVEEQPQKNKAAQELGRLGGLKGGKARAEKLTPERKREIAQKAAQARWKNSGEEEL